MKHHLVFVVSTLCAFASIASAQTGVSNAVNWIGANPATIRPSISISRGLRDYVMAKRTGKVGAPVVEDLRRYLLAPHIIYNAAPFYFVPQVENKTSPMIRKPDARYEYMSAIN